MRINHSFLICSVVLIGASAAGLRAMALGNPSNGNNAITGFRYQTCAKDECISVVASNAWLAQTNGAFVTDHTARLEVRKRGELLQTFDGGQATSQPSLDLITLETHEQFVLVTIKNASLEVIEKVATGRGGR